MKGVALGICPGATLVDITHEIAPQDIMGAALEIDACYRFFPPRTIFVIVVDPGVGSARRALAVESGGYIFVAPDNGVLSLVLESDPAAAAVMITNPQYARLPVSRTFEGRDRFTPAAAWVAAGTPVSALGPAAGPIARLVFPRPSCAPGAVAGEVIRVDRFGNLITNIDRQTFDRWLTGAPVVRIANQEVPLSGTYGDAAAAAVCALFNSSGYLEIAVNGGSAAAVLKASRGAAVHALGDA